MIIRLTALSSIPGEIRSIDAEMFMIKLLVNKLKSENRPTYQNQIQSYEDELRSLERKRNLLHRLMDYSIDRFS